MGKDENDWCDKRTLNCSDQFQIKNNHEVFENNMFFKKTFC